ncbi:NEL-type E3 ubiquitin ligase domain-containing protein [Pseudomonas sp. HS6-2]|uniref:NEL-type E3 ubiquitin ligase domain-containing protein n=1 Tax=Pseudomonas sp. HS6-2 TaxID=3410986 RepID=UPI003BBF94D9
MASANSIPSTSVDHLIARQLPEWVTNAKSDDLAAYHQALRSQQDAADSLKRLLGHIPDIVAFAIPLLSDALFAEGLGHVDPQFAHVVVTEEFPLPSAAEKLYQPKISYSTRQTLLSAALHNFEAHEAEPWLLRKAHLVGQKGELLAMTFEQYVRLCRTLDIGGRYQALLKAVLQPRSGRGQPEQHAGEAVARMFADGVKTRLRASVYEGRLKGLLDGHDVQRLQALVEEPLRPIAAEGRWLPRQLYLLGKCVVGVITLEWRPNADEDTDEIMLWIPGDPEKSLRFYDSWDALYSDLAQRLLKRQFRTFFRRFIKAQDSVAFYTSLSALLAARKPGEVVQLDGRHLPIDGSVFTHVQVLLVAKLFGDAAHLAVPTDVEDRLSRHRRLREMIAAGMDLVGLAAFVVPGLGELMLVVSAAQLLDEVYEGYQDWRLGDRQGALDHLFSVAQGLVLAGTTAGALHVLKRVSLVDALAPKVVAEDSLRLVRNPFYPPAEGRALAFLEQWESGDLAGLLWSDADKLLDVTGYHQDQLRRLHLEHAPPPARLLDMQERIRLHEASPSLRGAAFEEALQALRPTATDDQEKLIRAFTGLSPRGAQEIIEHSNSSQLHMLRSTDRVPLAMAERARWYLRDSRLDQAALGIRLPGLTNADTEQLIMALIERKAPWPANSGIELRVGHRLGRLLYSSEGKATGQVHTIVRSEQGYLLTDAVAGDLARADQPLLSVVLQCLDQDQKARLGGPTLQSRQLRTLLLETVVQDRERAATLIGLKPIGAHVRPPRRFADGRLGYPLSGGGESSRQAIRQGIHQIFPTLSELQLDAYLDSVSQRGENLWNHYLLLQRQLSALREGLRQWQADWQSPIDAIRRRRVADTLRRSWRRKLVDDNEQYELCIDGEQVGQLPSLPAGIDYAHVRRLTLRNMRLQAIDPQFLALFPNVVDLDLSGNRLSGIPEGIEGMGQLRRVNLGNNQIELDDSGSRRLARLTRLDTLILSYNPLNGMPDLSVLPHVRDIRLRSTGQVDIGQIHQNVALRAHIDLRDNRISQLHREVRGLRLRLQRLNLHENPLSEGSAQFLDEARGVAEAGGRGSASYTHEALDDGIRQTWVASDDPLLRAQREQSWNRLVEEPGSAGLFRFLADFVDTEDFATHPAYFRHRIWRILDACEHNEALREQLFREADGPRSCEDRLLLMLNQMEVGMLAFEGIEGVPVALRENRLLRLGRQLHRLDLLDDIANAHVRRMLREGLRRVDEIEVRLYYRSRLAGALDLPVVPDAMHFASFAQVSLADLSRAELEVLRADTAVAMLDALAERPFWQSYLRETFAQRFEALAASYHERLEVLEEQARAGQESDYDVQARTLMHQLAQEESTLMRSLTTEAWARSRYASHEHLMPV